MKAAPGSIDELQMLTRLHSLSVCLPIVSHEVSPALWMKQALPFSPSPLFPTALRCCTQFMTINYPQSPRTSNQLQVQMSGLFHRRHADPEVQLFFPCYFPPSFLKSLKKKSLYFLFERLTHRSAALSTILSSNEDILQIFSSYILLLLNTFFLIGGLSLQACKQTIQG